jgi:diaminohydroxyphosphoribosylaminopyrimidine deaminase/5-amino-6-(5-phosphoribosylamino)uracil reductase
LEVSLGVLAAQALDLIWPFVVTDAFARPFVLLKTATSLDGCFAPDEAVRSRLPAGPYYLTETMARRDLHGLRRWMDLVVVGERTVSSDRPRLDGRLAGTDGDCPASEPAVGYVDTDLSHGSGWHQAHYFVFAGQGRAAPGARTALARAGATVVLCRENAGHVDPSSLVAAAHERSLHCLMVEGGPELAAAFLSHGLVDRWVQYIAPVVVGSGLRWPRRFPEGIAALDPFELTHHERLGRDLRLVLDRRSFGSVLTSLTALPAVADATNAKGC